MPPPPPFVEHVIELLATLGPVRARRMFGAHGVYLDDLFVAIVAGERLYLKADDASRAAFEAAGCQPFTYEAQGRRVALTYWSCPDEALDAPHAMAPWARLALAAALRTRAAPVSRGRAPTAGKAPSTAAASPARGRSSSRSAGRAPAAAATPAAPPTTPAPAAGAGRRRPRPR